jgi:hypothetical protein
VRKLSAERPLEEPKRRWVNNIKMDLREIGWCNVDWIDLAQDRDQWRTLVNMAMNLSGSIKLLGSSRVAAQLAASQERLSSMMVVSFFS